MAQAARHGAGQSPSETRRKVQTEGKWRKCENPACSQSLFVGDIEKNLHCCKFCGHHFRIGARQRLDLMLDPGSWKELFADLGPVDALNFKALRPYAERLRDAQEKTGLVEAVLCGEGRIEGHPLVGAALDFEFIGASMGSVVGEKITRTIEHATATRRPALIFCCSGGARMDEGALSLMQMAKTAAAIARHHEAGLAYITVLTDPTMAGVSASFAFLADVILAEPRAMIGFTGARVIEQTLKVKLPEGFQEAEFLLAHGQIDKVVARKDLRSTLAKLLEYAPPAPPETPAPTLPEVTASAEAPASTDVAAPPPAPAPAETVSEQEARPRPPAAAPADGGARRPHAAPRKRRT